MSKLRSVSTAFWSDPFIEELTPNQKLLFLYLITNEKTNMLGIYESSIKKISFETGIDEKTILKDLKHFESKGKVRYENNYVILINFMKHQNFNTNMMKSAIDVYNSLPNVLKDNSIVISKDNPLKGFETLCNHFGMVRKVEVEYKDELEDESKGNLKNIDFECLEIFIPILETWFKYKSERKEKYKSNSSKEQFYKNLLKLSNSNFETAEKIINQSIGNNWAGVFELKNDSKSITEPTTKPKSKNIPLHIIMLYEKKNRTDWDNKMIKEYEDSL